MLWRLCGAREKCEKTIKKMKNKIKFRSHKKIVAFY